jgi:hypothetical protein
MAERPAVGGASTPQPIAQIANIETNNLFICSLQLRQSLEDRYARPQALLGRGRIYRVVRRVSATKYGQVR